MTNLDGKVIQIIKEASEATRWKCLDDAGELDRNRWFEETEALLFDEYGEYEDDMNDSGRIHLIRHVQTRLRAESRQRFHQYIDEERGADGNLDPLPTRDSLKGEMVTVPKPDGQRIPKLVIMCNPSEISAVVSMYAKVAKQNTQRRKRYERILSHMRDRGFGDDKQVRDLY